MENQKVRPIVKWAGGKTQLLNYITKMKPVHFNSYYEPFFGGGAVFFELQAEQAHINDINPELVNMYFQVKDNLQDVVDSLENLDDSHENSNDKKEYYYNIRNNFNENLGLKSPLQAARFIYLNKHCFNGLFRVNSKGQFNVPFNNKLSGDSFLLDDLKSVSECLKKAQITNVDFEEAVEDAKPGDFVFFDSPYVPLNPTSFTDYTKEGFDYVDHVRLSELYKRLSDRGVYCMLTNHNADLVNELYKDYNIKVVDVMRNINSKADNRKGQEVIITNYEI